jgi:uncharacterized protein
MPASLATLAADPAAAFLAAARQGKGGWRRYLLAVLLIVAVGAVILVPVGLASVLVPAHIPQLEGSAAAALVMGEVVVMGFGAGTLLAVRFVHRRPVATLVAPDATFRLRRVLLGAVAWLLVALVLAAPVLIQGGLPSFELPEPGPMRWAWLIALLLFPVQAAAEEVMFRGYLTQALATLLRWRWLLVLLVSLAFAAGHWTGPNWPVLAQEFIFAVALSVVSLRDGRLEMAIGAHAANNMMVLAVAGAQKAMDTLSGAASPLPVDVPIIGVVALVLAGGALKAWLFAVAARWLAKFG